MGSATFTGEVLGESDVGVDVEEGGILVSAVSLGITAAADGGGRGRLSTIIAGVMLGTMPGVCAGWGRLCLNSSNFMCMCFVLVWVYIYIYFFNKRMANVVVCIFYVVVRIRAVWHV
jgi:hypothetical protein